MKTGTNRRTSFPLRNFPISRFPFHIATILSLILLIIVACTSSTESSKGNLSGTVSLEGQEDFSEITMELYDLAYLDTTIVRINNEYPHIGVIINQHTEFDHRFQSPLYQTITTADGSFELKDIPTGKYNFVARKDGFGFLYITDMEISKGENHLAEQGKRETGNGKKVVTLSDSENFRNSIEGETSSSISHLTSHDAKHRSSSELSVISDLSPFTSPFSQIELENSIYNSRSDLTLYPETVYSGNISGEHIFETNHHYIIEDHTSFVPGSRLEIQPGAVVRINPGKDLNIYGNFKAQGEMNNMFWITSNDGFEVRGNVRSEKGNPFKYTSYFTGQEGKKVVTLSDSDNFRNSIEGQTSSNSRSEASNSLFPSPISHRSDEVALYNSMHIFPTATIEDDLIEWGKWDWGNFCLLNEADNLSMKYSIFANSFTGFHTTGVGVTNCTNLLVKNCWGENFEGISYEFAIGGTIEKNILIKIVIGISLLNSSPDIKNNFLSHAENAIFIEHGSNSNITNNTIINCTTGIRIFSFYATNPSIPIVKFNSISSNICIYSSDCTNENMNYNNLKAGLFAFQLHVASSSSYWYINGTNNYFYTNIKEEIKELIFDINDVQPPQYSGEVLFQPFLTTEYQNAGIQGE